MLNTRMRTTYDNLWGPLLVLLIVLFAILLRAMATADFRAIRTPLSVGGGDTLQRDVTSPSPRGLTAVSQVPPATQ